MLLVLLHIDLAISYNFGFPFLKRTLTWWKMGWNPSNKYIIWVILNTCKMLNLTEYARSLVDFFSLSWSIVTVTHFLRSLYHADLWQTLWCNVYFPSLESYLQPSSTMWIPCIASLYFVWKFQLNENDQVCCDNIIVEAKTSKWWWKRDRGRDREREVYVSESNGKGAVHFGITNAR